MFVLLIKISCDVKSQNSNHDSTKLGDSQSANWIDPLDTLCVTVGEIQKVFIAAKQKKMLDTIVSLLNKDNLFLKAIVEQHQTKELLYMKNDSVNKEIIQLTKQQLSISEGKSVIYERKISDQNYIIGNLRRRNVSIIIAGITVTVISGATIAYLLFK